MGAYSPAPVVSASVDERIRHEVIEPTLAGLAVEGRPYSGFLYAGVMIAQDGAPRVLEFNARLGDPETQPIMVRLASDLLELLEAAVAGDPNRTTPQWRTEVALGVVMAAAGYPGEVRKGDAIHGLGADPGARAKVFHAGTALSGTQVVTAGGRVLCVCGLGKDMREARREAYAAVAKIGFDGAQFRTDIGWRALAREGI
jgi:phosphoribosylamine--glycine ligase